MDLYVVEDEVLMGQGVFGVFSTIDRASAYMEEFHLRTGFRCAINRLEVLGGLETCIKVCVAYTYDFIHDVYLLDGLYRESWDAYEATGDKGLIVEFVVDDPESKQVVTDP